ncbi:MAG: protein-S-isoprenylcysteine O-methyltransferase [Bacteroidota bacterium]
MNPLLLKIIYGVFMIGTFIIRYPHEKRNKSNTIHTDQKTTTEKIVLFIVFIGMMLIPLLFIFTSVLSFADYTLPFWLQITGIALIAPTLWLFYRSHKDLGKNWSVTLEIREEHTIVDSGVYTHIRHPMYSAIWLWTVIQALLLHNYIAGLAGLISFGILYFSRVYQEEKMMLDEFGDSYLNYKKKTKRIIPFVF